MGSTPQEKMIMRLTMTLEAALAEFRRQAPQLVAAGDKARLRELYATLTAAAQNANPTEASHIRSTMTEALKDALAAPAKKIRRGIFDNL
jgi:hypothetical protein